MPNCKLVFLSSGIIILITSFFIHYYIKNIQNKQSISSSLLDIDPNTLKEIESNLIEDYQRLKSEVIAYNKTNDYIKQERELIALIEETLFQEAIFKEREAQLKAEDIKESFNRNDIAKIQSLISELIE